MKIIIDYLPDARIILSGSRVKEINKDNSGLGNYKKVNIDFTTLKKFLIWGTIAASFTIEDFSVSKLIKVSKEDLEKRYKKLLEYIGV